MQSTNEIYQEIAPVFSPIIGDFRVKTYFSYYAIFKDKSMIALYQDHSTYLRISDKYTEFIRNHTDTYNLSDDRINLQSKTFYYIPHSILSNAVILNELITSILDELEKKEQEAHRKKTTQIRNLPNMNLKLERMLKKIGIHSIQDFIKVGYIHAFITLVKQGIDATPELFFKLNGALNHQYIYTFTDQQKRLLMEEANKALYEAGLRKRFSFNSIM